MRRRWTSIAWLAGISLSPGSRPCQAADEAVTIACEDLSAEGVAEVEARTRTTLLANPVAGARLEIRCEASGATVVALAGARAETATVPLPNEHLEDALVEAALRALEALRRDPAQSSAVFPSDEPPPPSASAPAPPPLPSAPAPTVRRPSAPAEPTRAPEAPPPSLTLQVGAGFLLEYWIDLFTYGGRAFVEVDVRPWAAGVAMGGLTAPEQADAFAPTEWHPFAFGAVDAEALGGLRFGIGVGVSVLVVSPRQEIVARSETALAAGFADFSISRPLRSGRFAFLPELHLRVFSRRRDVLLDATRRLELPIVTPSLFVGVAFEL